MGYQKGTGEYKDGIDTLLIRVPLGDGDFEFGV